MLSSLKWPGEALVRLEEAGARLYLRKLVEFFLPSSNMFSRLELDSAKVAELTGCILALFLVLACICSLFTCPPQVPDSRYLARVGQHLLDFLLLSSPAADPAAAAGAEPQLSEAAQLLDQLLADILGCVEELLAATSPHNCVFR